MEVTLPSIKLKVLPRALQKGDSTLPSTHPPRLPPSIKTPVHFFFFLLLPNTSQPKPTSTLFTTRPCRFPCGSHWALKYQVRGDLFATSNVATIKLLQTITKDWKGIVLEPEFLNMRYCANILNLIVGDGLKEINASVAKVSEA